MPGQMQTPSSFIPRETGGIGGGTHKARGLLDLFVLVSIVLFVASGALGAGVFLYEQYLVQSEASKVSQLERASAAFEPALIQELARLDDRMRSSQDVLGRHIAPSVFFRMLEETTIQSVSFRTLTFEATDPQRLTISMDGIADSVNAIALQADLFSQVGVITNPIFSNIDRRSDGVHFSLTAFVAPSALSYASLVQGVSFAPKAETEQTSGTIPATEVDAENPFLGGEAESTE